MLVECATPSCSSRPGTRRPRCPALLDEARRDLPEADLLVIDDGSTDDTAAVARAGGAQVVSFPENHGLRHGIAEGYRQAATRGYAYCGRLDADGQHPPAELSACSSWSATTSATWPSGRASCPPGPATYRPDARAGVRHLAAAAADAAAARAADLRRHERHVRGQPARARPAQRPLRVRGARGRGADADHRRQAAPGRGAGAHAPARARRVVVPRPPRGRAGGDDRPHPVRG